MTYTVSSGTLNSTIPYHPDLFSVLKCLTVVVSAQLPLDAFKQLVQKGIHPQTNVLLWPPGLTWSTLRKTD